MKASTLLLVTWLIWIAAKGRLNDYWQLASTASNGQGAPEGGSTMPGSPSGSNGGQGW